MNIVELRSRGLLDLLDVELAEALARAGRSEDPDIALAIALTSRNVRNGHSCFPIGLRAREIWPREALPEDVLPTPSTWIETLQASALTDSGPLVLDAAGRLYLRRYWELERDIAQQLAVRAGGDPLEFGTGPSLEERLRRLFGGEPESPQAQAARTALEHRVSLLCGGPGTGKTTTVAAVVALLVEDAEARGASTPRIVLLAPTGKAAARLGDAVRRAKTRIDTADHVLDTIPTEASTVQRALGMRREGMRFSRNADRPLEADVIVVDEASMIDLALMRQLLESTKADARLIIVGDPNQLTSVEAGSVLQDLVTASSETWWKDRITLLTKTYRYDETQPLGRLIAAIRSGDANEVEELLERSTEGDLIWSPIDALPGELERAAGRWSETLESADAEEHFRRREQYVVLTPFRRGPTGTLRLGQAIEERLGAPGRTKPAAQPILIEENSSELRVYNGDFAMLRNDGTATAVIQSADGEPRDIAEARLPRYSSAYALSIHKAQGSEFDEVLVVLPQEDAPLLTRELLYTAISRARSRVRIVGPKKVLLSALARRARRDSGLVPAVGHAAPLKPLQSE